MSVILRESRTIFKSILPEIIINITKRGIRKGVLRTMRSQLPKYKVDTRDLPSLTTHLTRIQPNDITFGEALRLRLEKLEVYKKYLPVGSNANYLEALFHERSNDIDDVLKIIDENLVTLNSTYVAISFEVLNDLMEAKLCDPMTIFVSPEFKRLCQKTIFKVRFFDTDDLLKLIKCLANLKIPEDTLIVQAALQMTRHHINDFNYDEILSLRQSLNKFEERIEGSKSLLVALKKITPQALERQIKLKHLTPSLVEKLQSIDDK